ncbi:hypothetical protein D917_10742 [Trichinella nativa]|uniref:Dynein light intermediate chain n=1 Tax=Trichinella nativa TaxID=6335 RepID=A0A1Y3EEY9_9BILA|nr:hypothetical protein D917_10742 [Trichinella nativa]
MPMSITSPRHSSDKSRPSPIGGQSSNGLFSSASVSAGGSATSAQSKKADSIGKIAMQTVSGTGTGAGAAGSVGGGPVGPSSEGALAQFFNNLLVKRPASTAAGSAKLTSESSIRERTFDDSESETQTE